MLKFITHVHTFYSTDGWNNPDCVRKYAEKKDVFVELLTHNNFLWTKLYPEVFGSKRIVPAIEFGFRGTDVIAGGKNLGELAKDKRFPIFDYKVERMLDISLEEGTEILRDYAEYLYFPHPTFICGAFKNGYEHLMPKVDGIEIFNGPTSLFPSYNTKALNLAKKFNKTETAGVDGHMGMVSFNSCYNLVDASYKDEIYEAMRKGRVKPIISPLYPFCLAKEYGVLAFLTLKDLLNPNSDINLSNFI